MCPLTPLRGFAHVPESLPGLAGEILLAQRCVPIMSGETSSAARSDGEPATAPHDTGGAQSAGEPSLVRPLREAAGRQPLSAPLPGLAGEIQLAKEGA